MKVSKTSWHYKLYTFWRQSWDWDGESPWEFFLLLSRRDSLNLGGYRPKNLCRYFWTIVGLSLVSVFLLVAANVVLGFCILICVPLFWGWDKFCDRHDKKRAARGFAPKEKKGPGLVRSFVRAKKQKVCPLIEVVD